MWSVAAAFLCAIAQVTGYVIAIGGFAFVMMVLRLYDTGLQSAGVQSNHAKRFFSDLEVEVETAPYKPILSADHRTRKIGPTLYLLLAGIAWFFFSVSFATRHSTPWEPVGYFLGFPLGGALFRYRSRNWEVDRKSYRRVAVAVLVVYFVFTALPAYVFGDLTVVSVGVILATSISAGILIAGFRRDLP